jgi:hypothetical protein
MYLFVTGCWPPTPVMSRAFFRDTALQSLIGTVLAIEFHTDTLLIMAEAWRLPC